MYRTKRGDVSSRYVPKGARKIADRGSDAVVYLYERDGQTRDGAAKAIPYAIGYCGKRAKPDFHERYMSEASRERRVREYFEARRELLARTKPEPKPRALEVGDILYTSWGYDQTNYEFFQVTGLIGDTMIELRELAQERESEGWCRDVCMPKAGEYIGEPIRRKVSGYDGKSCRIDDVRSAWMWDGRPKHATSYA